MWSRSRLLAGRRGERVEREQQVQQQGAAQEGAEGRAVVRQQSRRTRRQLEQRRKRWQLEKELRAHTGHQVQYTISSVCKYFNIQLNLYRIIYSTIKNRFSSYLCTRTVQQLLIMLRLIFVNMIHIISAVSLRVSETTVFFVPLGVNIKQLTTC